MLKQSNLLVIIQVVIRYPGTQNKFKNTHILSNCAFLNGHNLLAY